MKKIAESAPHLLTYEEFLAFPNFKDEVAGSTSTSLSHILSGIHNKQLSFLGYKSDYDDYLHVNLIASRFVIDELAPLTNPDLFHQPSSWDWIEDNQGHGTLWAIVEFLNEQGFPDYTPDGYQTLSDSFWDILQITLKKSADNLPKIYRLFKKLLDTEEKDLNYGEYEAKQSLKRIKKYLPTGTITWQAQTVQKLHSRKGVQVFYKKSPQFLNFLRSTFVQEVDDNSLHIKTEKIPPEFIFAVVFLGSYEQNRREEVQSLIE